jgi:DNA polymerase I-like protein with 3'-5' exonuclease and polymerase domains
MRTDNVGLFWQDIPAKRGKGSVARVMPAIPETGWQAPCEFPRLANAPWLSLDVETKDPELRTHGPGWARGSGHIVGVSLAAPGASWYFPIRHEVCPEQNLEPGHVLNWLRDTMSIHGRKPVIGANLIYDLGWLGEENIHIQGIPYDVQFAEALLSEGEDVNLDALGERYLGQGKETSLLYQWSCDYYGGQPTEKQRENIYRCPPSLVGPYAQGDTLLPAAILPLQWQRLALEQLLPVFEMECRLIPLILAMRRAGVSIDLSRAEQVKDGLSKQLVELEARAKELVGFEVNVDANESMQRAFRALGLPIPLHPKTKKPSFEKALLAAVEHPFADIVSEIRKRAKIRDTFIVKYLLEKNVHGKLHCSLHPLRSDSGGTRSGRFSMSIPNGQNIPSRDEELAPLVRSCFVPDCGHKAWRRYDYNQIEYRELAHFAIGTGSDGLRQQYNHDPKTDYHINTQNLVTKYTGLQIPRKPIKNFNFGMTFGMGQAKMIRTTTMELRKLGGAFKLDGNELYTAYHEACPWTKATLEHYANLAKNTGFISTILGRRSRFDLWEPDVRLRDDEQRAPALPYELALRTYGRIKRAFTHKALNRLLQGSAADVMKTAMLKLWDSGVLDIRQGGVGVPRLTVHDELDFSDPGASPEAWRFVKHTMETAIIHRIPIIASVESGPDWGHCEELDA